MEQNYVTFTLCIINLSLTVIIVCSNWHPTSFVCLFQLASNKLCVIPHRQKLWEQKLWCC